ncbi:MAG: virulence RhuM family protein [bacterium]
MKEKIKKTIPRNSTAEFLTFTSQTIKEGIEVRVEDENVWLTQKLIGKLFNVNVRTINEHLINIFKIAELEKLPTIRKFRIVQNEGDRKVERLVDHFSLEVIIALGYRVNSVNATEFRKWATKVLKDYTVKGYVMDVERLKNGGTLLNKKYFDDLLLEIRDIRSSERRFYQKVADIYSTALDYDPGSLITRNFFATVQNSLHYAIHGMTAPELIVKRANHKSKNMGLTSWKKAPLGKIIKSDVIVAKNYLNEVELDSLNRIVSMYLDYAESQAEKRIPMTMKDWASKLNSFLKFNEKDILNDTGSVTRAVANSFAESEFDKFQPIQDKIYESDFDREIKKYLERFDH